MGFGVARAARQVASRQNAKAVSGEGFLGGVPGAPGVDEESAFESALAKLSERAGMHGRDRFAIPLILLVRDM